MPRRSIYFAKLTRSKQVKLADHDFRTDVFVAIDPRQIATRYGRTWRFARPHEDNSAFLLGKLGFTHQGEEERINYDEATQDFVTDLEPARQTFFSHFVIDYSTEVVGFEERGRLILKQSFIGAFEDLLRAADFDAQVELLGDPASFRDWAHTVERVVRIRAVVVSPNPGWVQDAGAIRQVVEEADAERVELAARATPDAGLNVDAPWIHGALHQITREGQGSVAAVGLRNDRESRWISGQRLRVETLEEEPFDDSGTIWTKMVGLLKAFRGS